jgi:RNA polymerase sigma-70 factor (ECF subfamily)
VLPPPRIDPVAAPAATDTDEQLVTRVLEGDVPAFTFLMRRYNRRVFRIARSVLRDDAEAEDACQDAWECAFVNLERLHHRASFSRWLGRIALRCAFARTPGRSDLAALDDVDIPFLIGDDGEPERRLDERRLADSTAAAIDALSPSLRIVLVLRDVEQATTTETAAILGVSEANVRIRLHRARARLRELLAEAFGSDLDVVYGFDGERCDRLVGAVVRRVYSEARYAARSACSPSVRPRSNKVS